MTILDRYVAKNFIIGYLIAMMVLVGLCIVIDLFVHLDEFAESSDLGLGVVFKNIFTYYSARCFLYFRDLAGMITVIAAVFSLAKMTRNNELIAIMASGVSLKRVIAPIIVLAIALTALSVLDQEIMIPRLTHLLIRSQDELSTDQSYDIWFMGDSEGALICTAKFEEKLDEKTGEMTGTMFNPTIIIRRQDQRDQWEVDGKIEAERATYNPDRNGWDLTNGLFTRIDKNIENTSLVQAPEPVDFYETNLVPLDIPMRQQEGYKGLLSYRQLKAIERQKGTRLRDKAELYLQMHTRITDPIINMVMLMVALPVLVCRDPKAMKSAIMISFAITTSCFIVTFICKMLATEVFFDRIMPEFWVWVPVFIFLPIALIELDSMKT